MLKRLIPLTLVILITLTACDLSLEGGGMKTLEPTGVIRPTGPPSPLVTIIPDTPTITPVVDISPSPAIPLATESAPSVLPTSTAQPIAGTSNVHYIVQPGTPLMLLSPAHPDCNWMGVGGQVFGQSSLPVTNLVVQLGGSLNGQDLSMVTMTGFAPYLGEGGYEFRLAGKPVESRGTLWLQLYDENWLLISDRVYFDTSSDCIANFILVNFNQVTVSSLSTIFLPVVLRNASQP
jgi:hypothetical protein